VATAVGDENSGVVAGLLILAAALIFRISTTATSGTTRPRPPSSRRTSFASASPSPGTVRVSSPRSAAPTTTPTISAADTLAAYLHYRGLLRAPRRGHLRGPPSVRSSGPPLGALDVPARAPGLRRPGNRSRRRRFPAPSVPFLLHVRQCRYYSVAIFAAIWILYFFFSLPARRRLAAAAWPWRSACCCIRAISCSSRGGRAPARLSCGLVRPHRSSMATAALATAILVNLPWLLERTSGERAVSCSHSAP